MAVTCSLRTKVGLVLFQYLIPMTASCVRAAMSFACLFVTVTRQDIPRPEPSCCDLEKHWYRRRGLLMGLVAGKLTVCCSVDRTEGMSP